MPPLGLLTVASLLPKDWDLKLIDMNINDLNDDDIDWADFIFVSAMIVQKSSFCEVLKRCSAKSKPVVAGGPIITSGSENFEEGIKTKVIGEIESIINDFISDLNKNQLNSVYKSVSWPDISNSPIPKFELLDFNAYASMTVQYSRGCPFRCEFCDIWTIYGNKPRSKNASCFIAELDKLYRLGWKNSVFIVDDNFVGNKKMLKSKLLPAITEWQKQHNFPFCFYTEASIDIAKDSELLKAMRAANFDEVFVGIESVAESSLSEAKKRQNMTLDLITAVKNIQKHGLEVMAGFIVGFDSDKADIFERQFDFIQKAAIPKAMLGLLTAVPGTALYKRLEKENRLRGNTSGNNTNISTLNFIPKMNLKELISGYHKVLEWLYGKKLKNYFSRCNKLLDAIEAQTIKLRKIKFNDILLVIKSFFFQIRMPYGQKYLYFLFRNFIKNRKLFPVAMKLAIQGHHFYVITRQTIKAAKISSAMDEYYKKLCFQINQCSKTLLSDSERAKLLSIFLKSSHRIKKWKKKINKTNSDFKEDLLYHHQIITDKIEKLFAPYVSLVQHF